MSPLHLFAFYLGGKHPKANIEIHNLQFAIGTKIEDCFIKNGCEVIKVEAFYPNIKARVFYEKMGFQPRNIEFLKITENYKK
jgi:hypothetical protein